MRCEPESSGCAIVGIGLARDRLGRQRHDFERAFVDQAVDDAGRHARILGGFGLGAQHAVGERVQHAAARRRHALRGRAGEAHRDALALRAQGSPMRNAMRSTMPRGESV